MKKSGHIWLLGLSGSGKSTVGPIVAEKLHLPFHDTDEIIMAEAHISIPEIFSREGEAGFRRREASTIRDMKAREPAVIACGGGAVIDAANREIMQQTGIRIYLRVPLEVLEKRLQHQQDRPLLAPDALPATLARQLAHREPWYRESEILIETRTESPAQVAERILAQLST